MENELFDFYYKKKKDGFCPQVCKNCGQTTEYLLPIDKGTVDIVKAVAKAIRAKGINIIHPRKEMEGIYLTSNQVGNLSRPRVHGLLARVHGEPGNWCLTTKGAKFLRGEPVPQFAIVSKSKEEQRSHKEDYWVPDQFSVTVHSFTGNNEPYWNGVDFTIEEGKIVTTI